MTESKSAIAIKLAREAFSSAQGDLGLIKFSVEELIPVDDGVESDVWELTCSFYENLGNPSPTKYKAAINLKEKTVSIKKLGSEGTERKYTLIEEGSGGEAQGEAKVPGVDVPQEKSENK